MEPARLVTPPKAMRGVAVVAALLMTVSACSGSDSRESNGTRGLSEPPTASTNDPGAVERGPLTVPSATDVLGRWRAVRVEGKRPPRHSILGINLRQTGHRFWAEWSDGLNEHDLRWRVTPEGRYRVGVHVSTTVGCIGSCTEPSGFGVADATAMRITEDGSLVFLAKNGAELARYQRA
jgi:hypothetical protein